MERPVLPSTKTPWFRYPEDLDPVLRDIRDNLDVLDSDVDDIQTGALPIPLAGISGALQSGGYTNGAGQITTAAITPALEAAGAVRTESSPTRSQSLRGKGTGPYWGPSEAVFLEDMDGRPSNLSTRFDNATAFADAVAAAKNEGDDWKGIPIQLGQGTYWTTAPIVLPKSGNTPQNIVPILGLGWRLSQIRGDDSFPTGRGLIEWDNTSRVRAWFNLISGLRLTAARSDKAKCIYHQAIAPTDSLSDLLAQFLHCDMIDLLCEGDNGYQDVLIDLEIGNRNARIWGVWGDVGPRTPHVYDTRLFRTGDHYGVSTSPGFNDGPGFAYCDVRMVRPMVLRGGYVTTFEGRMHVTNWQSSQGQSPRGYTPNLHVINGFASIYKRLHFEGYAESAQIQLTSSFNMTFEDFGIGVPNTREAAWQPSHAYGLGDVVVATYMTGSGSATAVNRRFTCTTAGTSGSSEPTWSDSEGATVSDGSVVWTVGEPAVGVGIKLVDSSDNRFVRRAGATDAQVKFSYYGTKVIVCDSDSKRNVFEGITITAVSLATISNEFDIGPPENFNFISGYAQYSGGPGYFEYGIHPDRRKGTLSALPTAGAAYRDVRITVPGTGGDPDETSVCIYNGSTYEWVTV